MIMYHNETIGYTYHFNHWKRQKSASRYIFYVAKQLMCPISVGNTD